MNLGVAGHGKIESGQVVRCGTTCAARFAHHGQIDACLLEAKQCSALPLCVLSFEVAFFVFKGTVFRVGLYISGCQNNHFGIPPFQHILCRKVVAAFPRPQCVSAPRNETEMDGRTDGWMAPRNHPLWPWVNIQIVPAVNISIQPLKNKAEKMGGEFMKIYLAASERLIFLSQNMSVVSTVQLYMTTSVLGYIFQHSSLLEGA